MPLYEITYHEESIIKHRLKAKNKKEAERKFLNLLETAEEEFEVDDNIGFVDVKEVAENA